MKRTVLWVLLSLIILLCACANSADPIVGALNETLQPEATVPTTAETDLPVLEAVATLATEPSYIYEGALEDYLLPVEEYSWERLYDPEFVMIHFISAVVNDREDPHNMQLIRNIFVEYNTSVHYIIERDGTIHCYIPENRVAWHAGKGEFNGDERYTNNMNQYAIGIEVVAIGSESDMSTYLSSGEYRKIDDSLKGFTPAQYDALRLLVLDLCERYQIPMDRAHIIGHEEYSPQKADPGELFDWSQVLSVG